MITTRSLRDALRIGAVAALAATAGLVALGPAQAVTDPDATAALDWVEGQMAAHGHHLVSAGVDGNGDYEPVDDAGLTIDALLAIAAADRAGDGEAQAAVDWVLDNASDYVSGASAGDAADSRYAGELGKLLLFMQVFDVDGDTVDGVAVEDDLRELMDAAGRFVDRSDFGDLSNGVKQAIDVLALADTDDGAPGAAVDYLLLQQCPAGGFRIQLAATQCTNDASADLDATSFALMALRALGTAGDEDAFDDGVAFLRAEQQSNGGFGDNANSTGLGASVLRDSGYAADADEAAAFVRSLQLTSGDDEGAILLDEDGYDAAVADGLDEPSRTIATRATAQGVLALGLPAYDRIGAAAPPDPTSTTSSTVPGSSTSSSSTSTSTSTTSTSTSSTSTTTTTIRATTTTRAVGPATTSRVGVVRTGADSAGVALVGGALLAGGVALFVSARRRRIVYPFHK